MGKGKRLKASRAAKQPTLTNPSISREDASERPGKDIVDRRHGRLALATISRSENYGDFTTGLSVIAASTSDALTGGHPVGTVKAHDVLVGIPVLWWKLETESTQFQGTQIMDGIGYMQSVALDSQKLEGAAFPMMRERVDSVGFQVKENSLRIASHTRELGLLGEIEFRIEPRLAWFLTLSQSLSVVVETPSSTYISTLTSDGHSPRPVVHDGTLTMKHIEAVLNQSSSWKPIAVGNTSMLVGEEDLPDHHTRTFAANCNVTDLPDRVNYVGECLACGQPGDSREHCVPKWIARNQGVAPVVAPVFCVDCNSHFGRTLEVPIEAAARAGTLESEVKTEVFVRWALKTSFTLSAASDVSVDNAWMQQLRQGFLPDGFQIFASAGVEMDPGYLFSITHFSRGYREKGHFLFSFAMNSLLFVVLRNPSELLEVTGLSRVHPPLDNDFVPGHIDANLLHDYLIFKMTGHQIYRTYTSDEIGNS